ncbi:hypothetical protein Q8F55_007720 [Vanrija albida]|uniref:MIT domain-containing protein n=1 Tax=Vanrija albida TaxID=181172 RepID=A0ABR3PUJ2_9TREE
MENGTHLASSLSTSNGDLKLHDGLLEPTKGPTFASLSPPGKMLSSAAGVTSPDSTIASLLPDHADAASDAGSQRSSMQPRVPSRQLLQTALDLAQRAVEMDKGNDVAGALAAYRDAVTKLRVVMERVGVEPTATEGKRSSGKNEEEGRTLRGIHDAYMARITLLSAYEDTEEQDTLSTGLRVINLDSTTSSVNSTPPPPAAAHLSGESPIGGANEPGSSAALRSPVPSSAGKRRKKPASKQSFGLDEEADLSGVDGVDDPDGLIAAAKEGAARSLAPVEASPRSSIASDDRPLPPLPPSTAAAVASVATAAGAAAVVASPTPATTEAPRVQTTPSSSSAERFLVSPTTAQGTISQRRNHRPAGDASISSMAELSPVPTNANESVADSMSDATSSRRIRTRSTFGTNGDTEPTAFVPLQTVLRSTLAPPLRMQGSAYLSPRPDAQPVDAIHRPFHLFRILYTSMDTSGSGAYLTNSLHIDPAVWKPANWRAPSNSSRGGHPKLAGQEAKVRAIEALLPYLDSIKTSGAALLEGKRENRYDPSAATRLSKQTVDLAVRAGDDLSVALEGLDDELDVAYKTLQSKGVSVGTWKGKSKSSWGSRLSARVDKMSRGNDSPDRYVDLLGQLFYSVQVIDDHLRCFTGPCTPSYNALSQKTYKGIESRITRAAQFVGTVVVPFVLDDFRLFMLGYLKGGVRYLED